MEINNTKEDIIELLKLHNDILIEDIIKATKTLYFGANNSLERATILNTVASLVTVIRQRTDDLIERIEKDT